MIRSALIAAASFAGLATAAWAEPVRTPNVEAELVSSRAAVAPGERFLVGFRQAIRPGWHTYWRNAGDSGIPTTLQWTLAPGYQAGPIEWPAPKAIKVENLVNYGYSGEVLFPIEMTAPANARGVAKLQAHAEWLVCEDICIPESAELNLEVIIAPRGKDDPLWSGRLAAARASIPRPGDIDARLAPAGAVWSLTASGGTLAALVQAGQVRSPLFFPFAGDAIDHAADQAARITADGFVFKLTPAPNAALSARALDGVITFDIKEDGAWVARAFEISAPPGSAGSAASARLGGSGAAGSASSSASASMATGAGVSLAAALVFAFIGGLILNVMPCVFPVLSIKALSLARAGHESEAARHGFFFLAGVMATFLTLAGALIALQAAGAQIGWGFQLQEPLVVAALALLFFAIGLNLLGAYEIGGGAQNAGAGLAQRGGDAGAFFTGALAVVAASPCTAPFMGAAMGFAATQPPLTSLAVFAALGAGFALPFFLLSVAPPLRKALPRPGAWMDVFKQFLAFPMFAAAIWLVWVLAQQAGPAGLIAILAALLAFAFAVWALRAVRKGPLRWFALGLGALVVCGAGFGLARAPASGGEGLVGAAAGSSIGTPGAGALLASEAWTPGREAELRAQGKAVFVNFTAAWCVTCQVNEKVALQTKKVARAFADQGVVYLKADWTTRNGVIAQALKSHGRAGVPLYLFYPAGAPDAPAKVLPQILTPGIVLEALGASALDEAEEPARP